MHVTINKLDLKVLFMLALRVVIGWKVLASFWISLENSVSETKTWDDYKLLNFHQISN